MLPIRTHCPQNKALKGEASNCPFPSFPSPQSPDIRGTLHPSSVAQRPILSRQAQLMMRFTIFCADKEKDMLFVLDHFDLSVTCTQG